MGYPIQLVGGGRKYGFVEERKGNGGQ